MAEEQTPVKEETQEEKPKVSIEDTIAELERLNLTDVNKLRGKLQNAEGYKTVQAEKDRLTNELQSLKGEIESLKASRVNKIDLDEFGDYRNNPIDFESTLEKILDRRDEKKQREQLARQQAQMAAYQKITKNKFWKEVGPKFEERMRDPEINLQVQLGQMDPVEMYQDCVVEHFQDLSQKSLEALKLATSNKTKPPHVEGSARAPGRDTDTRDEKEKKIDELRARSKSQTGLHQDEQMELINAALGDFIRR